MAEQQLLLPLEKYLKAGLHIGNKFRTKYMSPFIYKIRPDGLSVLNIQEIDKRLKIAADLISQYNPEDILLVCRRENGWDAAKKFAEVTGVKIFAGRYPPGILTNPNLENFMETKLVFITDPVPDKNVVIDAAKLGIPVISLCDTNNDTTGVDFVIPCNNKGKKSLGLIFYVLAREYLKNKNLLETKNIKEEDFESE